MSKHTKLDPSLLGFRTSTLIASSSRSQSTQSRVSKDSSSNGVYEKNYRQRIGPFFHLSTSNLVFQIRHFDDTNASISNSNSNSGGGGGNSIPSFKNISSITLHKPLPASSSSLQTQTLTQTIEDSEKCPICLSAYIYPVSTKCGHVFCKACIIRHVLVDPNPFTSSQFAIQSQSQSQSQNHTKVVNKKCPLCNYEGLISTCEDTFKYVVFKDASEGLVAGDKVTMVRKCKTDQENGIGIGGGGGAGGESRYKLVPKNASPFPFLADKEGVISDLDNYLKECETYNDDIGCYIGTSVRDDLIRDSRCFYHDTSTNAIKSEDDNVNGSSGIDDKALQASSYYQAIDGQYYFLNGLNAKMVQHHSELMASQQQKINTKSTNTKTKLSISINEDSEECVKSVLNDVIDDVVNLSTKQQLSPLLHTSKRAHPSKAQPKPNQKQASKATPTITSSSQFQFQSQSLKTITAPLLSSTSHTLTPLTLKRLPKFLSFLPLYTTIHILELDLKDVVGSVTLKAFKDELGKRHKIREVEKKKEVAYDNDVLTKSLLERERRLESNRGYVLTEHVDDFIFSGSDDDWNPGSRSPSFSQQSPSSNPNSLRGSMPIPIPLYLGSTSGGAKSFASITNDVALDDMLRYPTLGSSPGKNNKILTNSGGSGSGSGSGSGNGGGSWGKSTSLTLLTVKDSNKSSANGGVSGEATIANKETTGNGNASGSGGIGKKKKVKYVPLKLY